MMRWLNRLVSAVPAVFIALLAFALAAGFGWLGYLGYLSHESLKNNGITTTATIASFEGSFQTGRRAKKTIYNYWIEYDGFRRHFQWKRQYQVGDRFIAIYDKTHAGSMKPLAEYDPSYANDLLAGSVLVLVPGIVSFVSGRRAYRRLRGVDP